MTDQTGRVLEIAGVRSPVLEHGPRSASEAVVFVHGNPGPKEDWADLMARLGPDIRAVAPDMPGYGAADRPRDFDYTVEGYARHLAACLDELGVTRAHLVLHDFGGPWGLRWAADHRDRLASVVLINTGILIDYRWHKLARIWQKPVLGELFMATATRGAYRLLMNRDNPKPFPDEFIDRIYRHADWGHKRAILKLYRASRRVSEMSEALAAELGKPDVPALVVWGAEDRYLPMSFAARQAEHFPHATVHALDGLGHWPFVDDPERVAALVVPFLQAHVPARAAG